MGAGETKTATKEEAKQRRLFARATRPSVNEPSPPIIYQGPVVAFNAPRVAPMDLARGVVPLRLVGRKPPWFFSVLKRFLGTPWMGFPAAPAPVSRRLQRKPPVARVCGFLPPQKDQPGRYSGLHVPSRRRLEQFAQGLREAGIWAPIKGGEVKINLPTGVIEKEKARVGDTTP